LGHVGFSQHNTDNNEHLSVAEVEELLSHGMKVREDSVCSTGQCAFTTERRCATPMGTER